MRQMDTETNDLLPGPAGTRLGVIIRVAFFIAAVLISALLLENLLGSIFGAVTGATIGIFATGLAANLAVMQIFDRRPLSDIGLTSGPGSGRNFGLGLLLGGGAAALLLLAPLIAGTGHLVQRQNPTFAWTSLGFYLVVLLFGAAGEEMVFRGYAFQLLVEKIGPFATILPIGIVFGFSHGMNPHVTDLALLNTTLWGVLLGYSYIRSHDLWLPIALHFGWNATLPLFGVTLSGLTIEVTRYEYKWDLGPLWSGGNYGPEAGLLTTIFVIAVFFALSRVPVVTHYAAIAISLNEPV